MTTAEPGNGQPRVQRLEPTLERSAVPPTSEASLGELLSRMSQDMSTLFRKEVELAKFEVKEEAVKAGKGAGLLGGSGVGPLSPCSCCPSRRPGAWPRSCPPGWLS